MNFITLPVLAMLLVIQASWAADSAPAPAMPAEMTEAMDLDPDVERGKEAYRLCATCHYDHGWGKEDGSFPSIAGQHRSVVIKQIADFRARNRDNPTMFPFSDPATIGGAQAIADVAAYIEGLPINKTPGKGPGTDLDKGRKLFDEQCALCHADDATGSDMFVFPRLQSQHYEYLKRQMLWIRDGHRRNPNLEMKKRLDVMSDADIDSIADYISRIEVN